MDYRVEYTAKAQRDLKKLGSVAAKKVLKKVYEYSQMTDPMQKAGKLAGDMEGLFRFKVGSYRVVFRKDKKTNTLVVIVVLKIAHRRDVYRKN